MRVVDGIRVMLGLEAKAAPMGVGLSLFTFQRAVQEIPGVKLDARLSGVHLDGASG